MPADRVALPLPAHQPHDPRRWGGARAAGSAPTRRSPWRPTMATRTGSPQARAEPGSCRRAGRRDREDGPPRSSTRPSSPRSRAREAARGRQADGVGGRAERRHRMTIHRHCIVMQGRASSSAVPMRLSTTKNDDASGGLSRSPQNVAQCEFGLSSVPQISAMQTRPSPFLSVATTAAVRPFSTSSRVVPTAAEPGVGELGHRPCDGVVDRHQLPIALARIAARVVPRRTTRATARGGG